jgi:hypothetical protein
MGLAALLFFYIGVLGNFQFVTDMAGVEFETEVTPSLGEKADSSGKTETQPPPTRPARLVRAIEGGFFFVFPNASNRISFVGKDVVKMLSAEVKL